MSYQYDPFSQKEQQKNNKSKVAKVAKGATKQVKKRALKKLTKKTSKLLIKAIKAATIALIKALLAILSAIGLPAIIGIVGIILLIIIITLVSSYIFGGGVDLNENEQKLYDHIVEESNNTIDSSMPEQEPYKVPVELIASVVQLEIMKNDDHYQVVTDMANALKPTFNYSDEFNEWTETKTRTCKEGEKCKPWSKPKRDDNYVTKLVEIDYWQGNVKNNYTPKITKWKTDVKVKTITEYETVTEKYTDYETKIVNGQEKKIAIKKKRKVKKKVEKLLKTYTKTRRQYYKKDQIKREDYTHLDTVLNSLEFGKNDKKLLEVNYTFQDLPMNYIAWLEGNGGSFGGAIPFPGTIVPGSDIPAQYMPYYLSAEKKFGVHWYVLASVHRQETVFSTIDPMISSAGAEGHMQFMPCTWLGWSYAGCTGTKGLVNISSSIKHDPNAIKKYGGYGVDANNDGKASPWDIEDAIHTAANYLSKSGYATDPRSAILNYNHAGWYADEVLARAKRYQSEAVYNPNDNDLPVTSDGAFTKPVKGVVTSRFGPRSGGMHYGIDLGGVEGVTPIVAAADGVITRAEWSNGGYGNVVYIKHKVKGKSYETVYAHQHFYTVRLGQTVKKGQQIGVLGNTGDSTGPHLHFEVHVGGWTMNKSNAINPERIIAF